MTILLSIYSLQFWGYRYIKKDLPVVDKSFQRNTHIVINIIYD